MARPARRPGGSSGRALGACGRREDVIVVGSKNKFGEIRIMDLGLLYRALVDQQVDVVAGNATDGQIESLKLKVLVDDRGYFPPCEAAPVVRRVVMERYPALAAALEHLGGTLSAATMRRLNYAADGEHRDRVR